jgi:hypothetical protein
MESLNSLLKLQTARSPNIGLDARVKLKKQLGSSAMKVSRQEGPGGNIIKCLSHETLLRRAAELVREAEQFVDEAPAVLLDLERWSRPAPIPGLPDSNTIRQHASLLNVPKIVHQRSVKDALMGTAYSLAWSRLCPNADLMHGISFGHSQTVVWVCAQRYEKTMGVFVRASLKSDGSISFQVPLECSIALDLFSGEYNRLAAKGGTLPVYEGVCFENATAAPLARFVSIWHFPNVPPSPASKAELWYFQNDSQCLLNGRGLRLTFSPATRYRCRCSPSLHQVQHSSSPCPVLLPALLAASLAIGG